MIFNFLLLLFVIVSVLRYCACTASGYPPYEFDSDANVYVSFHRASVNWMEAWMKCYFEGALIMSPLDDSYSETMSAFFPDDITRPVFTGISAVFAKGDYYSLEGKSLTEVPQHWVKGEPNNKDDRESCIAMFKDGKMLDVDCNLPLQYFCYRKSEQTGDCQSPGYKEYTQTGHCYKSHKVPRTWLRAFQVCASEGAYLGVLNSQAEANIFSELFRRDNLGFWTCHIGMYDVDDVDFINVHGQTVEEAGYVTWHPDAPSNFSNTQGKGCRCVGILTDGRLKDNNCEAKRTFICELEPID